MKVFAILALTTGLVAAAAKAPEGDVVFRVSEEEDGAGFEHEQFWVDRDSNQVEGHFSYMTPEGRELETRYSAGLNGFTAEGDHLPVAVEDTAEVAEARADFMAYMIELMAKQDHEEQMNMAVHEKSDVGAIDYADLNERNDFLGDMEVIESSRKRRSPNNGYYQRDEMESRGMVDFSHDDFEDQLAMPSGAMSYSQRIQPMRYYGAAKKSQMAAAAATSRSGSVYPTDPYNFASKKVAAVPAATAASFFYRSRFNMPRVNRPRFIRPRFMTPRFYTDIKDIAHKEDFRPPMPSGMTKSTSREKTLSMMPVKAPLNKYTVPASTYYPFQQQQQPTRMAAYMPTYMNMAAKRPMVSMYHTQFQHPYQPMSYVAKPMLRNDDHKFSATPVKKHPYQPTSYAAKPKAQDQMPTKTMYPSSYNSHMSAARTDDHKFSATPKKKVLTKLPYFSYSTPAKTVAQTQTKTLTLEQTKNMYKNHIKQYSDYSIPMRPAEKQQLQRTFPYHQGFHQPMMSQAHHSHYPMYPTTSGSYHPSGFGGPVRIFRGNGAAVPLPGQASPPGVMPTVPVPGVGPKPIPQAPGNFPDNYPGAPAKPIPQVPGGHPGQYPAVPARPIPQVPGSYPSNYPVIPVKPIPQAPGTSPDHYPAAPAYPIPQAPGNIVGGDHPHHAGHGPGSATDPRPPHHVGHGPAIPAYPIPQAPGYPAVPAYPIPQAPGNVVGGDHPHHAGHGPGSATDPRPPPSIHPGNKPQVEEPANSQGSVPNIPEVDQPAAILF